MVYIYAESNESFMLELHSLSGPTVCGTSVEKREIGA